MTVSADVILDAFNAIPRRSCDNSIPMNKPFIDLKFLIALDALHLRYSRGSYKVYLKVPFIDIFISILGVYSPIYRVINITHVKL